MSFARLSEVWKVDGQPIYEPSVDTTFDYASISAEGSGRQADGYMRNRFVRNKIAKVGIKYPALTRSQVAYIISLVQGREFELTYPDMATGSVRTMTCIVAESKGKCYSAVLYDGLYRDVTFNCVEN